MDNEPKVLGNNLNRQKEQLLTLEEADEILYWSFFHSQGDDDLQLYIFNYIATKHRDWRIPNFVYNEPMLDRYFSFVLRSGAHARRNKEEKLTKNIVTTQVQHQQSVMESTLHGGWLSFSREELLFRILYHTIDIDEKYRTSAEGRPRQKTIRKGYSDPAMSHFAAYVLSDKRPPGPPVYSEMMDDLKKLFNNPQTPERLGFTRMERIEDLRSVQGRNPSV